MQSARNDDIQFGSLRIRLTDDGRVALICYNGQGWDEASNSNDTDLQRAMHAAVAGKQPGLYVPSPQIGMNANVPLKAA